MNSEHVGVINSPFCLFDEVNPKPTDAVSLASQSWCCLSLRSASTRAAPGISLELLKAPGAMLAAAGEKPVAVFFDINVDRLHVPCAVLAHR